MKFNHFIQIHYILFLLFFIRVPGIAAEEPVKEMLKEARKQFYASIEDKKQIERAINLFETIAKVEPKRAGLSEVYIGVLVALKGKHSFLPHTKLKWTKRGLSMMDNGLNKAPNDIESLFIHGMTCYYLPFFFRRADDAHRNFKEIIKRMPREMHAYPPQLMKSIIVFLLEHAKLTREEQTYLQTVKATLHTEPSTAPK